MKNLRKTALARAALTQKIRDFFNKNNFLEVETPIMVAIPGMEPHLTPFETRLILPSFLQPQSTNPHTTTTTRISKKSSGTNTTPPSPEPNSKSTPLYLNTSPELQMKKLLGTGFGNIFNITKVFRNGELGGPLHNPEFTMIEWYRENANYMDLMTDCENLILELIKTLNTTHNSVQPIDQNSTTPTPNTFNSDTSPNKLLTFTYQSHTLNLAQPWPRLSIHELFLKFCNIDLLKNLTHSQFKKTTKKLNYNTNGCQNWDDIFFKLFLNHIEPELAKIPQPVFIYDYPSTQAALAKKSTKNPFFAERFELYMAGIEIANAFSELINPVEQHHRLQKEQKLRKKLHKIVFPIDEEFLTALSQIKNPYAGIAMGLDRLFMILLNKKSIEEMLLFPMDTKNFTKYSN